ncbi:MAG: ATP-binding protein [Pseudomonadota bacterium]
MIFRSLFGKIFLWFWITMIAVVIATAISGAFIHQRYDRDRLMTHFAATQAAYARAAGAILEAEGLPALEDWLHQLRGPGGLPGRQLIFAPNGEVLFGGRGAKDLKAIVIRADKDLNSPMPVEGVFFDPIYSASGDHFWFVSDMRFGRQPGPKRRFFRHGTNPLPRLAFLIGVAVLVSGIVCYALARYLTRPIRDLRRATQQLASGDFSARVKSQALMRGDELGELSRDFDRMAEKLARLQQAQAALVRDVSHELRSPLARLQVALGLAEQRDDGRAKAELARIDQEIHVLDELVSQLLSVARLEASDESLSQEQIDLADLIATVCTDASFEGNKQNKIVHCDVKDAAIVMGDRSLLRSAVENIVRNALRHTPEATEVLTTLSVEQNTAIIRIKDAGPGVPADKIADLFKPFVRVESARDRDSGGFGLGLAIASAAIQRHEGTIEAGNHLDGGLEVTIVLPVAT